MSACPRLVRQCHIAKNAIRGPSRCKSRTELEAAQIPIQSRGLVGDFRPAEQLEHALPACGAERPRALGVIEQRVQLFRKLAREALGVLGLVARSAIRLEWNELAGLPRHHD